MNQYASTSGHAIMTIIPRELRKEPVENIEKSSGIAKSARKRKTRPRTLTARTNTDLGVMMLWMLWVVSVPNVELISGDDAAPRARAWQAWRQTPDRVTRQAFVHQPCRSEEWLGVFIIQILTLCFATPLLTRLVGSAVDEESEETEPVCVPCRSDGHVPGLKRATRKAYLEMQSVVCPPPLDPGNSRV
jgi:hypothetical protein